MLPMAGQSNCTLALAERLREVKSRIAAAAARAGRSAEEITLVAVTKTHPPQSVVALMKAGHSVLGENRVQEALSKIESLKGAGQWHFVGHLQRNKVNAVMGRFELIHSVDSPRLIRELEKSAARRGAAQRILLELNVTGETRKTGARPEELDALLDALAASPHLRAEGLMTMAPYSRAPEASRPAFARLRELLKSIPKLDHFSPRHLSMGMSGDYEVAIEEGATLVRIGTAIMGERINPDAVSPDDVSSD